MTDDPLTSDLGREARALRKLVDNMPALLAYWDRDKRNVVANAAYLDWFGLTPEQMKGMHIREVTGEALYQANLPFIEAAERGEEQHFDRTLVDAQGAIRHSQVSYVPEIVDGEVVGYFVMVADTTAKVDAQRQLDDAQSLAHVGSWVYNPASGELFWSQEMFRLMGVDPSKEDPSLSLWAERTHPDDRERTQAVRRAAWITRRAFEQHYRLLLPDGTLRYVASRGRPEEEGGQVTGRFVGTLQDETDIIRMTQELTLSNDRLATSNTLLSDTVAMLGHDVRQPIQAVTGFLELTEDAWEKLTDDQRLDNVRRALAAGHRLRDLVDNILTLMNVESGTLTLRPASVNLAEAVDEAIAQVLTDEVVSRDMDPSVVAWVDPFHLAQVLTNLLSNAVKYGAPPLAVTVRSEAGTATLDVVDHGEGVPAEFLASLFDRFSRAETGAAATATGSGFGLYLARTLVHANGGELTHQPHQPTGSRFRITLPTDAPEGGSPSPGLPGRQ